MSLAEYEERAAARNSPFDRMDFTAWRECKPYSSAKHIWLQKPLTPHQTAEQKEGLYPSGHEIWMQVRSLPLAGASALNLVLRYPATLHREWKKMRLFFFGNIYRKGVNAYGVRYLYFYGQWRADIQNLDVCITPDSYIMLHK